MEKTQKISRYQMLCFGFLAVLSPLIRLLPRQLTLVAGDSAWISVVLGVIPAYVPMLLAVKVLRRANPDEGYGELFNRALGKPVGRIVTLLFALWLIFYISFSLRSGADRYIVTAYRHDSPVFFVIAMLLLSAIPLFGNLRSLARAAQFFFPLMMLVMVMVFVFATHDVELSYNAPLFGADYSAALSAAPFVTNVLALTVFFGFMEGSVADNAGLNRLAIVWVALMIATIMLLCLFSVGIFGAELVSNLDYTFFTIVRSISIFGLFERQESLVLAFWVISDFIFLSSLMYIVFTALKRAFGFPGPEKAADKLLDMKNGRFLLWVELAAVLAVSLLLPDDAGVFAVISQKIVPIVTFVLTVIVVPVVFSIGMLRKKL
ncbi:MAG: hypothetical protein EOM14_05655 [Clostridia bacterium]|nr:hypothetical protein [Clostridia bacterium]